MAPAWIAVVGTLLGGLLVGLLGITLKVLELRFQKRSEERIRVRTRLELLHQKIETYKETCRQFALSTIDLSEPERVHSGTAAEVMELTKVIRDPIPEFRSLTIINASEYLDEFSAVLNTMEIFVDRAMRLPSGTATIGELRKGMNAVVMKCDRFNQRLVEKLSQI